MPLTQASVPGAQRDRGVSNNQRGTRAVDASERGQLSTPPGKPPHVSSDSFPSTSPSCSRPRSSLVNSSRSCSRARSTSVATASTSASSGRGVSKGSRSLVDVGAPAASPSRPPSATMPARTLTSVLGGLNAPDPAGDAAATRSPVARLQEENRVLREELAKRKMESLNVGGLNRRPLAAIAGGGFRGLSSAAGSGREAVKQFCSCEALRARVNKLRSELQEAQHHQPAADSARSNTQDASVQTTCDSDVSTEVDICVDDPPPCPKSEVLAPVSGRAEMGVQAVQVLAPAPDRAEMGVQVELLRADVEPPPEQPSRCDSSVQTFPMSPPPSVGTVETQTEAFAPEACNVVAPQVSPERVHACTQASGPPIPESRIASTQTTRLRQRDAAEQAGASFSACVSASTQVGCPPAVCTDAGVQAQEDRFEEPKKPTSVRAFAVQTAALSGTTASTQTSAPSIERRRPAVTVAASQTAGPPPMEDRWTQIDDRGREDKLKAKQAELEAVLAKARSLLKASEERCAALHEVVQHRAFRQLNVTILCPRAECTIRGERLEMDSWDPVRIRAEFESEVLPRFSRVFVEELDTSVEDDPEANGVAGDRGGSGGSRPGSKTEASSSKSVAVDQVMADFAEAFRQRLSSMLCAPSASAAYAAASTKSTR